MGCGDKVSHILWGFVMDQVYVPPLAKNQELKDRMRRVVDSSGTDT
jgi:hypothetical protein